MSVLRILVVEDDAVIRKIVRTALETEGYGVLEAPDGASAIAQAAKGKPQLVLQDIILPDMDGFMLVGRLRSLLGAAVPIVAFTGAIGRVEDESVSGAGFDGLIVKPVSPARLLAAVRVYLRLPIDRRAKRRPTKRVLLVDDSPAMLELHVGLLERMGFTVATARDGTAALSEARRQPPDVILSDVLMPGMDGFHLAAAVRQDKQLEGIPLVLITAGQLEEADSLLATRVGAQALLKLTPNLDGVSEALHAAIAAGVAPDAAREAAAALEEDYSGRLLTQLDRQVTADAGLAERATLQAAALGVLAAIGDALGRGIDFESASAEALRRCVDTAGLSRAAMLLRRGDGSLWCAAQTGFDQRARTALDAFLIDRSPLDAALAAGVLVPMTPGDDDVSIGQEFLVRVSSASALLAPMTVAGQSVGALLITSGTILLDGDDWRAFANIIASQLGQADALSRAFGRLAEAERRARNLFENVKLVVLGVNTEGRVEYVNPYVRDLLETTNEEIIGKSWFDYVPTDQREAMQQAFLESAEDEERTQCQSAILTRSGEERMIAWHKSVLRDERGRFTGILSIGEDVTARIASDETLRESEVRFRQIAENANEVFFLTDARNGQSLYVSPAYERIWGRTRESLYAAPYAWAETIHPDDREAVNELFRAPLPADGVANVFRILRPDNTVRWIRSRTFPVRDASGEMHRVVGVSEDITELRETEGQLAQANKMEAVGLLAGGIAHDFNNLLAAITIFTELAAEDLAVNDPRAADLASVLDAAKRATSLTRQLLAFSRQQVLRPKVLDLNLVIKDVGKLLTRLIGEDITLESNLEPLVACVRADAGQLEQVLLNLAVNARDAMPTGGKFLIETRNADLDVAAARTLGLDPGRFAVITASDTGTGMSTEIVAHIFEPFFTTKGSKGTGLGLATVYGIVKQSGGHIGLTSEPGRGTTFTIHLPETGEDREQAAASSSEAPLTGGSETILVAEDDPAVRQAIDTVLKRLGYTVLATRNGEEALARATSYEGPIHMVISDVVMPGMDGPALVKQMRKLKPKLTAILMSGYAGAAIARRGVMESGLPFLDKPFSAASLARKVRQSLDAGQANGTPSPAQALEPASTR